MADYEDTWLSTDSLWQTFLLFCNIQMKPNYFHALHEPVKSGLLHSLWLKTSSTCRRLVVASAANYECTLELISHKRVSFERCILGRYSPLRLVSLNYVQIFLYLKVIARKHHQGKCCKKNFNFEQGIRHCSRTKSYLIRPVFAGLQAPPWTFTVKWLQT